MTPEEEAHWRFQLERMSRWGIDARWHYRCARCGVVSVFSLDYPAPGREVNP